METPEEALLLLRRETEILVSGLSGERPVHGDGRPSAAVMLVGEAPGARETEEGRPFVGAAGKTLNAFLSGAGIDRSALYVTNAVKFRPTKPSPATGKKVNRPPTLREIAALRPVLLREIEIIRPKFIVTLGNSPLKALKIRRPISEIHGQLLLTDFGRLFPMFHPAALIYNRALTPLYEEDMGRLADLIGKEEINGREI